MVSSVAITFVHSRWIEKTNAKTCIFHRFEEQTVNRPTSWWRTHRKRRILLTVNGLVHRQHPRVPVEAEHSNRILIDARPTDGVVHIVRGRRIRHHLQAKAANAGEHGRARHPSGANLRGKTSCGFCRLVELKDGSKEGGKRIFRQLPKDNSSNLETPKGAHGAHE